MRDFKDIKKQFPIFTNIPGLVFLDNASTTQKPDIVLEKLNEVYTQYNSNVHRGLYPIADQVNSEYELAREKIAKLINADKEEIIFTSGTTDSTNLIAQSLLFSGIINKNSLVLTTEMEHHANFLPLQRVTEGSLEFARLSNSGLVFDNSKNYDVVAYSIISNVTGAYTDIRDLKKDNLSNAIFIADAAQAISHLKIDVKEMDVDFLVFSGHKMFGPTGIGVVYGKKELLQKMEPYRVGGGMISEVSRKSSSWAKSPYKFEAGTPPIADAIALGTAVDFINQIGITDISEYEQELRVYAYEKLTKVDGIKIYHNINNYSGAVISFTVENVHPHDMAQFLGDSNICVRAGHHCTQILHKEVFEIPASIRASFSIYNTKEEIDLLVDGINNCIKFYKHSSAEEIQKH